MIKFCKKCQTDTDRRNSGKCKPCAKESHAKWCAANPEKTKAYNAIYYASNLEKAKHANAAWQEANPEKARAAQKAWRAANPGAKRIQDQNRRARKLDNGGTLSKGLSVKLFKLQKGKCACCGKLLGDDFHLDHIVPLSRGGNNQDSNIQLLTPHCNLTKSAKDPIDFMQQKGFLL